MKEKQNLKVVEIGTANYEFLAPHDRERFINMLLDEIKTYYKQKGEIKNGK